MSTTATTTPDSPAPAAPATADVTLSAELWQRLLDALALPADADAETLVASVEDMATAPPAPVAASAAGLVSVDPAALAELKADAQRGRTIAAAAATRERETVVAAAIAVGKIPPSRREHWTRLIAADPNMVRVLASVPDNTIPLAEIGHDQVGDELTEPAAWFH